MPRTAEFDPTQALRAAMLAFWANGYEATSLQDLLSATGLSKSSLYATFGGKRQLFLAAFAHYQEERLFHTRRILAEAEDGRGAIASFFRQVIVRSAPAADPEQTAGGAAHADGCMNANEAVELAPRDADVRAMVAGFNAQVAALLAGAIRRGQADGSIRSAADAETLAGALLVYLQGIWVMARAQAGAPSLLASLEATLTLLDGTTEPLPPAQPAGSNKQATNQTQ